MEVLGRLLYLLALLGIGIAARRIGVLNERRTDLLTAVAFYAALPALVFYSTYDQSLGALLSPGLVAAVSAVFLATAGLAWIVHRRRDSRARQSVAVVQSYHSNLGFLGLPLVATTFGAEAAAVASIVLGIGIVLQVPLTVLLLVTLNDADAAVRDELGTVATNPVLAALAAGLVVSTVGLSVPAPAVTGLGLASELALPVALLCVGASLRLDPSAFDLGDTGSVVAVKVGCMPAIAWVALTVAGVETTAFAAVLVMFAMPTAVSTFVYANELGGDANFASMNVFVTTLVSLGTLFPLLKLLG
jgi:predicted permease